MLGLSKRETRTVLLGILCILLMGGAEACWLKGLMSGETMQTLLVVFLPLSFPIAFVQGRIFGWGCVIGWLVLLTVHVLTLVGVL